MVLLMIKAFDVSESDIPFNRQLLIRKDRFTLLTDTEVSEVISIPSITNGLESLPFPGHLSVAA